MVVMEILYVFSSYIFHYFGKDFFSLLSGGIHTKFASKQRNCPNLPTGEPSYNYYYLPDNIDDYSQLPNPQIVQNIQTSIRGYGIYSFPQTLLYYLVLFDS